MCLKTSRLITIYTEKKRQEKKKRKKEELEKLLTADRYICMYVYTVKLFAKRKLHVSLCLFTLFNWFPQQRAFLRRLQTRGAVAYPPRPFPSRC